MTSPTKHHYIDFASGDLALYTSQLTSYTALSTWLTLNHLSYSLPPTLTTLTPIEQETLSLIYPSPILSFNPPPPLTLPRLVFKVSHSEGLKKTTKNFLTLLRATEDDAPVSKLVKGKKLMYNGVGVSRIEEDFLAQMGDVTRADGSGGESIYGGSFGDEKEGLKTVFEKGTIGMANKGKNSNTSQFFITLTSTPTKLKKLTGNYVAFAKVDFEYESSRKCLQRLEKLAGKGGVPKEAVWIEGCGEL